jgi:hypothetical protein
MQARLLCMGLILARKTTCYAVFSNYFELGLLLAMVSKKL